MENNVVQMNLIGFHHFKNKEGTEEYHIVQCAYYEKIDEMRAQMKAVIIPIFVDLKSFQVIANKKLGEKIDVEIKPNLATGKIHYKVQV